MKRVVIAALALLSSVALAATPAISTNAPMYPKTAVSTDESDLWWNPSESGWGMQVVQESSFIFATLFIYGSDGRPTWASAQLNAVGPYVWSGPLYVTSGPWFGGPFDPNAVGVRQAGTMTFSTQSVQTGTVTYSIDGVQVTKQVQRQTLVLENYTGNYVVGINFQASGCFNPSQDGVLATGMAISISQTGTNMSSIFYFPNGGPVCTYSGTYDQSGHVGGLTGNFSCSDGEVGQMRFFEMTNRVGMISARLRGASTNSGCQYTGYFSGIDPNHPPQ